MPRACGEAGSTTHLYSAKAANFVGLTFAAALLIFETYPVAAFHGVIAVCIWTTAERLLVFAFACRVDQSVRSVFHLRRTGPG